MSGNGKLKRSLQGICKHSRQGSHATQADRFGMLMQFSTTLNDRGYRLQHARNIKPKHIDVLLSSWRESGLKDSTISNRLSTLRFWCESVDKASIMHRKNEDYGVQRQREKVDRAQRLDPERVKAINDQHTQMTLKLQAAFGLRREEAIKFKPALADKGDKIALKGCWTKGGIGREIPVRTEAQRALLDRVKAFCGDGSLIPKNKNYIQQRKAYENYTLRAGIRNTHGLRHQYARVLYQHFLKQGMSEEAAKLAVSRELGHNRTDVTEVYLGAAA